MVSLLASLFKVITDVLVHSSLQVLDLFGVRSWSIVALAGEFLLLSA